MVRNDRELTIEGDLFSAFVAAGAISKANADDPKKSSLVRCARTDRGVHAAGNIISMKLIVEDPDIVEKINEKLTPQIRVWGIERTNGSFSAYQLCDSRIYEYLIPTYCFLPPHPHSFLGKELVRLAQEANDVQGYEERHREISDFWKETEERHVKPFLEGLDPALRSLVEKSLYDPEPKSVQLGAGTDNTTTDGKPNVLQPTLSSSPESQVVVNDSDEIHSTAHLADSSNGLDKPNAEPLLNPEGSEMGPQSVIDGNNAVSQIRQQQLSPLDLALKALKSIIISAKKAYRIDPIRLGRVQSVLSRFNGTHSFHNYTIQKTPYDPSAKRVIKSFVANSTPIVIGNTEWLSLKVHGQSFMFHQIRKMVTMAALVVRCGCPEQRMQESYGAERLNIPKAPSLGLLLERPVFDTYNNKMRHEGAEGRGEVGFEKYEDKLQEFKKREIYERIFMEEERDAT